jgi:hypothetical protein
MRRPAVIRSKRRSTRWRTVVAISLRSQMPYPVELRRREAAKDCILRRLIQARLTETRY